MNMTVWIASTATLLVGLVVGLLYRQFFPAYLSEKGRNTASKEDLDQLTHLVESAKATYTSEIERLKAGLLSEGQVTERRRRVYEEMCLSLRVFSAGADHAKEANERFLAAYAAAWLWASDPVLEALNSFVELQVQHAAHPGSVQQPSLKTAYASIILTMRKDAGFADTLASAGRYQFVQF